MEVRAVGDNAHVGTAVIERVGVGEVFLVSGHSVAQGQEINLAGSDDDRVNTVPVFPGTSTYRDYENTGNQAYLPRNFGHYGSGVAPGPFAHGTYFWGKTGQYLAQRLNVPILIFNAAFGGTNLEHWAKSAQGQQFDHLFVNSSIGMPYRNVKNTLQLFISQTGVRGILADHGQNDWANTNENQLLQYYQTWVNQARSDLNFPSLAVVVTRKTPFNNTPLIRRVQERMSQSPNCFPGPDYDLLNSNDFADRIHLSYSGAEKAAQQWSNALNESFFASSNPYVLAALSEAQPVDDNPPSQPGNQTPVAPTLSPLTATVNVTISATTLPAFSDAENDPLTYALTGLPDGLNFDAATRTVWGTPRSSGAFPLQYSAKDPSHPPVSASFNLIVGTGGGNPVISGNFEGYLESVNCDAIAGWIWDRDKPNTPLPIEFLAGASVATAVPLGTVMADAFRQDLKNAGKGNGAHGYSYQTPESLKDNQPHAIWARVQGSEFVLKWSPKTITCVGSATPPPAGNAAPVAPAVSPLTATVNVTISATTLPAFSDAENDPLTYALTGLPDGLNFDAATRTVWGTPRSSGAFPLQYSAKDPSHPPVSASFNLIVGTGGGNPVISGNFEGYLESVNCDAIAGWIWDRDKPNTPLPIEFLAGASVATAVPLGTVMADAFRQDLKNAGKGNGAHGYSYQTPESLKDNQPHAIWARVQGSEFVLKWSPKTITCVGSATPPPAGNAAPVAPAVSPLTATVNVTISATTLPAFSDAENDPLTYALTGLPDGLNFDAATRTVWGTPRSSGAFPLQYSAKDPSHPPVSASFNLVVGTGTTTPPDNSGTGPGNYEGFLEVVDCSSIRGWIWDRDRPNTPIRVEFVDGNTGFASTEANIYRDDLKNAGKGNGVHGYNFDVPNSLKDGLPHAISGRVPGSNYTLKWSPKVLNCPNGARKGVESDDVDFITVSPNPSRGQSMVQYRINAGQRAELQVTDVLGRLIWKKSVIGTNRTEHEIIDLGLHGANTYLIQLKTDQQILFKRLLINP